MWREHTSFSAPIGSTGLALKIKVSKLGFFLSPTKQSSLSPSKFPKRKNVFKFGNAGNGAMCVNLLLDSDSLEYKFVLYNSFLFIYSFSFLLFSFLSVLFSLFFLFSFLVSFLFSLLFSLLFS